MTARPTPLRSLALGSITALAVCSAAAMAWSQSDETPAADSGTFPMVSFGLSGVFEHQFKTDIKDDNGSFRATRFGLLAVPSITFSSRVRVDFNLAYAFDDYGFSGDSGLGGMDPWDDIHTLRFAPRINVAIDDQWTAVAVPMVGFSAESGADFGDAITGGGVVGVSYRASDRFTIGAGVGVLTQIEDSTSVFPVIVLDWRPTDTLRISTIERIGAAGGGGLEVSWTFAQGLSAVLGGRYDSRRFRLDDDNVGEERGLPIYGGLSWTPNERARVSLLGGVVLAGELRLDDDRGKRIMKEDYETSPFIGVHFNLRF